MSVLGFVFAFFGGLLGAIAEGDEGFWFGIFLGYSFGAILQLSAKVKRLEQRLIELSYARVSKPAAEVSKAVEPESRVTAEPIPQAPEAVQTRHIEAVDEITEAVPVSQSYSKPEEQDVSQWQTQDTLIDKLIDHVRTFFTDGNVVLKVGLIVLFFGLGFLMKYAYEHSMLPVWLRLVGAGVLGIALLVTGWRVRLNKQVYALLLQGGGVGVLYLTVFSAAKLYGMIPIGMAFVVMVLLVVLSGILAVMQDAKYLAIYGAAGGFLAPVLASTGSGNYIALFSFYALLNAGILGIAWYRSWRVLNLVGFAFTFVIGTTWGAKYYQPEFFASVEPFLILFFVFFVCISVLFAFRQPPQLKGYVDSTLVFGVPIIGFALQAALVRDMEYGMAFSALAVSAFYIVLASTLWRRGPEGMRLLTEAFLALGVVFGSLAIPLALDGRWTTAAWALEGAAIVWVGIRQNRMLARAFGLLLQFGAGYFFLVSVNNPVRDVAVFNGIYLGAFTISMAGLFSSFYMYRRKEVLRDWERGLHIPLLIWGLAWWFGAGVHEIFEFSGSDRKTMLTLIAFATGSFLLAHFVESRLKWTPLRGLMYAVLPAFYVLLAMSVLADFEHPFDHRGWIVWPLAIATIYFLLYRYNDIEQQNTIKWQHVFGFWFMMLFVSWEMAWQVDNVIEGAHAWRDVMFALTPALIMFLLFIRGRQVSWPVARHYDWYVGTAALPVMIVLMVVAFGFGVMHEGNPWPLVYLPLLNPIDLAVAFLLYLLVLWRIQLTRQNNENWNAIRSYLPYLVAGLAFLWLNGMIARSIHHWFDVAYDLDWLLRAVEFKATISVAWTIVALSTMLLASRKGNRQLWFTGLGLFALVVIKLFMFDLSRANTLAIIISLILVGGLTVVFGYYLSPLPPRASSNEDVPVEEKS